MADPHYPKGAMSDPVGESRGGDGLEKFYRGESDPGVSAFSDLDFNAPKGTPKANDQYTSGGTNWTVPGEVPPARNSARVDDAGTDLKL